MPTNAVTNASWGDVFGLDARIEEVANETSNTGLVATHELRECLVFAGPHRGDEVGILCGST